jgi:hypothetical protein
MGLCVTSRAWMSTGARTAPGKESLWLFYSYRPAASVQNSVMVPRKVVTAASQIQVRLCFFSRYVVIVTTPAFAFRWLSLRQPQKQPVCRGRCRGLLASALFSNMLRGRSRGVQMLHTATRARTCTNAEPDQTSASAHDARRHDGTTLPCVASLGSVGENG